MSQIFSIDALTFSTEIAPSNRALCRKCQRKILKGELRLVLSSPGSYGNETNHYLCKDCAPKVLIEAQTKLSEFEKEF
jgi:hypothetical protein